MSVRNKTTTTTIAVQPEVLALIAAIAEKRGKQLGFVIAKSAIVRNLVVAEARALGLYPKKR